MSDIWPIENLWAYIKEKLEEEEFENVLVLKKKNCNNLEYNNSGNVFQMDQLNTRRRLQALIKKNGYSINKKNYSNI